MNRSDFAPKALYVIGGICVLVRAASIVALFAVMVTLGPELSGPEEHFVIYQWNPLEMLLREDFLLLFLLGVYLGLCLRCTSRSGGSTGWPCRTRHC